MDIPDKSEVISALKDEKLVDNVFRKALSDPEALASLQKDIATYFVKDYLYTNKRIRIFLIQKVTDRSLLATLKQQERGE